MNMGLTLFILGVICILTGVALIIRIRLERHAFTITPISIPAVTELLHAIAEVLKALAKLADKILGRLAQKEITPVLLIILGFAMCIVGMCWK